LRLLIFRLKKFADLKKLWAFPDLNASVFAKSDLCPSLISPAFDNALLLPGTGKSPIHTIVEGIMKISKKLIRQSAFLLGTGLTLQASHSVAARCDYIVQSDWGTGFVAAIRITNDTGTPIDGWSVNWAYTDGSRRTGGWNANFSGSNPYTASALGWNSKINPGQTVEFGIQGNKGVAGGPVQRPVVTGSVCSAGTSSSRSISSSSSSRISTSSSVPSSPSSSSQTSSSLHSLSSLSSSSSSSSFNTPPIADLETTVHGLTLHVSGRGSRDVDSQALQYTIDFGDGRIIKYPEAWHTYQQAGDYQVSLTVSDGVAQTSESRVVNVQPAEGNRAPIARLTTTFESTSIIARGTSSYDEAGVPLTFEWDFGDGAFIGTSRASTFVCSSSSASSTPSRLVTLTVSDGELKDTLQRQAGGRCGTVFDVVPSANFTYRVEGQRVFVDGSTSRDETGFQWDFGDGATAQGLLASHEYAAPGVYNLRLSLSGPSLFSNSITKSVTVGSVGNSSVSSTGSVSSLASLSSIPGSSSQASLLPGSSTSSSRSSLASASTSSDRNHYNARRAVVAPVVDGAAEAIWDAASWAPIDVFWLGTQSNPPTQDYTGRYKALWDEDYLYLLVDITDDRIYDGVRDALDRYWEDDTVELFIDENKNGGQHSFSTSAWAYHISTYGDVVDYTTSGPKLLNDHIDTRLVSNGSRHVWELRIRIYGEDYADWKANTPLKLFSGKLLGFSASYIDNDGSPQRESMMGSVDTPGHRNNQGYLDASVFGSLRLVE
jgi:hypothetical protein